MNNLHASLRSGARVGRQATNLEFFLFLQKIFPISCSNQKPFLRRRRQSPASCQCPHWQQKRPSIKNVFIKLTSQDNHRRNIPRRGRRKEALIHGCLFFLSSYLERGREDMTLWGGGGKVLCLMQMGYFAQLVY